MFLTVAEVARMLRVQPTTVRRWVKSGVLRGVKLNGRLVRIPEESLKGLAS